MRMKNLKKNSHIFLLLFIASTVVKAQLPNSSVDEQYESIGLNTITTTVPFLLISPDSRAGGLGDVGVATSTDANSNHWNTAKLGFAEEEMGLSFSYIPWLRQLVPDINMAYVGGYYKISDKGALGASLRYFSLGEITFTNDVGDALGSANPNELAIDLGYGQQLSDNFSGGFALRYIYSNLTANNPVGGNPSKAGVAVAVDINALYKKEFELSNYNSSFSFGLNFQNIGNKISYSETAEKDFIPINMKIGAGLNIEFDEYNEMGIYVDVNKLMVPTQPVYLKTVSGQDSTDANNERIIAAGKDPNVPVATGVFQSFYDAPGGATEEWREYNWSIGLEYWYAKQFAIRTGFFYEHPFKGDRQYFTLGAGLKYNIFNLDFSYLVPTTQTNPLQNTLRFSLSFDFEAIKNNAKQTKKTNTHELSSRIWI